jgi:hypothetical protein
MWYSQNADSKQKNVNREKCAPVVRRPMLLEKREIAPPKCLSCHER